MLRIAGKPGHSLLDIVARTAWSIDGECYRFALFEGADESDRPFYCASRSRSAAAAVSETPDDVSDIFAIFVFARQYDDATIAPKVSGRQDAFMPERIDDGRFLLFQFFKVLVSMNFPSPGPRQEMNQSPAYPSNDSKIELSQHVPSLSEDFLHQEGDV